MRILTLAVIAVALCSAQAGKMTPQERKALERQLVNAPFKNKAIEWDDGDVGRKRIWNPFGWVMNLFKNRCQCTGIDCNCCFKFSWINYGSCLKVEHLKSEKKLRVNLSFDEQPVAAQEIGLTRNDKKCGTLPAPVDFADYCLSEKIQQTPEGVIVACFNLQLNVGTSVGAEINFKCFEIRDGRLTIGGFDEVAKNSMFNLRVKDPFQAAVQLYSFVTAGNQKPAAPQ